MNPQWLTVQSFQDSQDLLFAINTLSIHTKLELAGRPHKKRAKDVAKAKVSLTSFLEELGEMAQQIGPKRTNPLLGVDSRRRELVKSYISEKLDYSRFNSPLFRDRLSRVVELLDSEVEEDRQSLLHCLAELRIFIEEHIDTDTAQILGGI